MDPEDIRLLRVVNVGADDVGRIRSEHGSYDLSTGAFDIPETLSQFTEHSEDRPESTSSDHDHVPLRNRQRSGSEASIDSESSLPSNGAHSASSRVFQNIKVTLKTYQKGADTLLSRWQEDHSCLGWRFGVLSGCGIATFVLLSNISLLIVGATRHDGFQDSLADIYQGEATATSRFSTGVHVLINVLSTLLLSASNYTMQVLSSPTRLDLDAAHGQKQWLDIGILSIRNVRKIDRRRRILWAILAISSVPLHLFYNSAIFNVIRVNPNTDVCFVQYNSTLYRSLNSSSSWNLTNDEWPTIYNGIVAEHGDLYLIADRIWVELLISDIQPSLTNLSSNIPILSSEEDLDSNLKFRFDLLDPSINKEGLVGVSTWDGKDRLTTNVHVRHAFADKLPGTSSVQMSLYFLIVVIVCNIMKLTAMVLAYRSFSADYVVTLGDAVSSYLERPDPVTVGLCALDCEDLVRKFQPEKKMRKIQEYELEGIQERQGGVWQSRHRHYISALSRPRRLVGMLLMFLFFGGLIAIIITGSPGSNLGSWGTSSITALDFSNGSKGASGTLLNAWLANAPQLLLSMCYLIVNGLCTGMASAKEWNHLAGKRRGLRVTSPKGQQRNTYFLQLPYRFATPLLVISAILHWLTSQSFFLIRVDTVNEEGVVTDTSSKCGFSTLSFLVLCLGFLGLILGVAITSFIRFPVKIPFAASCSFAISAACHPPEGEQDAHLQLVKWGVVGRDGSDQAIEHCSISARPVKKPKEGPSAFHKQSHFLQHEITSSNSRATKYLRPRDSRSVKMGFGNGVSCGIIRAQGEKQPSAVAVKSVKPSKPVVVSSHRAPAKSIGFNIHATAIINQASFARGRANSKSNTKSSLGPSGNTTTKVKVQLSSALGGIESDSNPESYSSREATPPYTHPSPRLGATKSRANSGASSNGLLTPSMWISPPRDSAKPTEVKIETKFTFLEPLTPSNYLSSVSQDGSPALDDDQDSGAEDPEPDPPYPTKAVVMFYYEQGSAGGRLVSQSSKMVSNSMAWLDEVTNPEEYFRWKEAHKDTRLGPKEYWDIVSYHEHAHQKRALTL
ncbi:hypothetical protein BU16DRAFT_537894 [Lophium mytilinum]|uniref:DUF6536 domain-containing protein n=1 Tax=Lophium mytilinum TaxID=390894 RepID=A0A6A6QXD0_9PEZI|nr:hypothetical protein BU16DRAFT_537894 [Lophium mytilinum]